MANKVTMELLGLKELDIALKAMLPEMEREKVILRALHDGARPITADAKRRAPVLDSDGASIQSSKDRRRKSYVGTKYRRVGALRSGIVQHTDRHNYRTVLVRVRNRGYIFDKGSKSAALAGNPNYWWLVHFGTSKMRPRRFLYDAFEANKAESARLIQISLLRGVGFVAQKLGFNVSNWGAAA